MSGSEDNQPTQDGDDESDAPNAAEQAADFVSFVVGLATSALAHLGGDEAPADGPRPDLALARQTIDILGMLEQKTKGNLTGDEERILGHVLYDLRMRYVESVRRRG
ncbi:MAG: DUF1844 domain-containing protein [Deltaproteobacteria bacterium]|nr:DUF1844 domain-containing protein [Deltaproteobacteria bacterium]